jgi:HSP20 family protein
MSLIKWEPFDEFDRFLHEVPTLPSLRMQSAGFDLAADVYEDGDAIIAEMNLPGLQGEDIDVEVEDNHLRVSGKREEVNEKREKNHYTKEIRRGSFERIIPLPAPVRNTDVKAVYEEGVLKVTMPRREETREHRIKVEVK